MAFVQNKLKQQVNIFNMDESWILLIYIKFQAFYIFKSF